MATISKGKTFTSGETVTPTKLNDLVDNATVTSIQTADIADGQITSAKIADETIVNADINASAAIAYSKLNLSNSIVAGDITSSAVTPAKLSQPFTLATAQASTSGTSIDFTGIPSWAKRITVFLMDVSTSGTSALLVQIGAGSVQTTGYNAAGGGAINNSAPAVVGSSSGFIMNHDVAADARSYQMQITHIGSNKFVASFTSGGTTNRTVFCAGGGSVTLSNALDRVRITTVNGTDTFDAGTINIAYEG